MKAAPEPRIQLVTMRGNMYLCWATFTKWKGRARAESRRIAINEVERRPDPRANNSEIRKE